jgi:hypothetical protein
MIIYNKIWLDNLSNRRASLLWLKKGLISADESKAIEVKHPTEYKPQGFFARIGMFIFATIIVLSSFGLLLLISEPRSGIGFACECILISIGCYGFTEHFVKSKNHFRSGIVDAGLYLSLFGFCTALIIFINESKGDSDIDPLIYVTAVTPFVLISAIRFTDAFLALIVYCLAIIMNALLVLKLGTFGKVILPFECMVFSGAAYYWVEQQQPKRHLRYWDNCLWMLELASIISLYLAGNYMVVRKLSEALLGTEIGVGEDIHFAFLFYIYTIAVPLAYIWIGLKKKNRLFIRLGVLLVAAGVLSIKYYHSVLPIETALILSGTLLVVVSWLSIRYLKTPRHGITSATDDETSKLDRISNIAFAAELVTQNQQQAPSAPNNDVNFGGGQFGGGGAGADY